MRPDAAIMDKSPSITVADKSMRTLKGAFPLSNLIAAKNAPDSDSLLPLSPSEEEGSRINMDSKSPPVHALQFQSMNHNRKNLIRIELKVIPLTGMIDTSLSKPLQLLDEG